VKPPLLIISPFFPPKRGGLADHTERLAQAMSAGNEVTVLTSAGGADGSGYRLQASIRDWGDGGALLAAIEQASPRGPILWQYVPHMYGRGGANLQLPGVMAELARRGRRQLLIAHEIAARYSPWPQRFYFAWAQRRQWRTIVPSMDFVGISTEAWLEPWCAWWPEARAKFVLLPSPSSVPLAAMPENHRGQWRERHGLSADTRIIAYFGSTGAGKQFPWVMEAWRRAAAGPDKVALAVMGGESKMNAGERSAGLLQLGYLPPEEVSATLQAADILALPFDDGVSERRTSAMAGLQHGCAVVTTVGANTGPTFRRAEFIRATDAADPEEFNTAVVNVLADEALRVRLGSAGRVAYERDYSWPVVAGRLESALAKMR